VVDRRLGRIDTLPHFRRAIAGARLDDAVIPIVGRSATVARHWSMALGMVFIDGGHTKQAVQSDFRLWGPFIDHGGILAIHDVFPDPGDGGQAPHHVYLRALASGEFEEVLAAGSLRGLKRVRRSQ
jgi:predicted O-methyltransferase YrrM